jgi:Delta6-protoilludene synthase
LDRFAEKAFKQTDPKVRSRFLDAFQGYAYAVAKRNSDKDYHRVRSIDEYFTLRRDTIAYKTVFTLYLIDIDLPDKALDHPHILQLEQAALDMMIISNDLCSYNVESVVTPLHFHCQLLRGLTSPQTREG